jgi:hypothetical protein
MTQSEQMADPSAPGDDDADLRAFEAMREKLKAEGIGQETPEHLPGLIELFRRAGLLQDESNHSSTEQPPAADDA